MDNVYFGPCNLRSVSLCWLNAAYASYCVRGATSSATVESVWRSVTSFGMLWAE